jgi:hypothetical protein
VGQASGTTARLFGVAAASPAVAWAVGGGGTILRTTDVGATWRAVGCDGGAAGCGATDRR